MEKKLQLAIEKIKKATLEDYELEIQEALEDNAEEIGWNSWVAKSRLDNDFGIVETGDIIVECRAEFLDSKNKEEHLTMTFCLPQNDENDYFLCGAALEEEPYDNLYDFMKKWDWLFDQVESSEDFTYEETDEDEFSDEAEDSEPTATELMDEDDED